MDSGLRRNERGYWVLFIYQSLFGCVTASSLYESKPGFLCFLVERLSRIQRCQAIYCRQSYGFRPSPECADSLGFCGVVLDYHGASLHRFPLKI